MKCQPLSLAVFLMSAALVSTAWSQGTATSTASKLDFPQKGRSISVIVPVSPGGGLDQSTRVLVSMMEKEIATPISVVNKVGAGGQVGLTELVRSKPDGYTLAAVLFPFIAISPMDPRRQAIYNRTSFQPIATIYQFPKVLVVQTGSPYKTTKDVIDAARANPERIKAAAGGRQGDSHLGFIQLEQAARIKFARVHFDGGAPSLTALLGGHVEIGLHVPPEILSHTKSGTLRALGVSGKQESKFFPGVRTLEAQGYPVYMSAVAGLVAPAGIPKEVLDLLSEAARKVIESDNFRIRIEEIGGTVFYQSPQQFAKFWTDYDEQLKPLMEQALQ